MRDRSAVPFQAVKITPLPSGSTSGHQWSVSPLAGSTFVSTCGSPPAAATRRSPLLAFVANTMVSSGPQLAPRNCAVKRADGLRWSAR